MKILLVEDEQDNAQLLQELLTEHYYIVDVAYDGRTGLDFVESFDYDLLLVDIMLPEMDGISLCRKVRKNGYQMPILLLTALDEVDFRVKGLDSGADDYVSKPYNLEELLARIRALLRRGQCGGSPVIEWGDLCLNPNSCEATYENQLLPLTPKEYRLLELFMRKGDRVLSHGAIIENLWHLEDPPQESSLKAYIKRLRHKFQQAGAPKDLIETVYGLGYRLNKKWKEVSQSST
ncbi:MAG: response regulator transcription factor [Prochloraceae cyanobacterium]|nr:response regulator transcription factor [Prochloraceae cyanobacterium]